MLDAIEGSGEGVVAVEGRAALAPTIVPIMAEHQPAHALALVAALAVALIAALAVAFVSVSV
jgi:hypothetical protein